MERPRQSTIAIGLIGAGITAYELLCDDGETISDGIWDYMERSTPSRIFALGAVGVTAAHLMQILPESIDPFKRVLSKARRQQTV